MSSALTGATAAAAAAGGAALAAYLDARLHVRRDVAAGSRAGRDRAMAEYLSGRAASGRLLVYHVFEERAAPGCAAGDDLFLLFEGRSWTYREFFEAVTPVANWLIGELGVARGDMVALDGGNSPEWLLLWLALEAAGAVVAFLNCNLTGRALAHCVRLSGATLLLADEDVRSLVRPVEAELLSGEGRGSGDDTDKDKEVEKKKEEGKEEGQESKDATGEKKTTTTGTRTVYYSRATIEALRDRTPLPADRREGHGPNDVANLIYTSGTTGLPKGTVIGRGRECMMSMPGGGGGLALRPGRDRMYTCLPLYHGAAHGLCVLACVGSGAAVVLSRKFSHARFWPEVVAGEATWVQYVGELCRYLVNAPPGPLDRAHRVHTAWGNGMRPDVWERFRERFGIETVLELYAATDGMLFTANPNRGPFSRNAIAVRGPIWHLRNGGADVRVLIDPDTQEILRKPASGGGLAIQARAGEAGEALVRMDPSDPDAGQPSYYGNHAAAERRRVRDVLAPGDLWFRTGDLMRLDRQGRLFFVDRLGDTFRWRSENVSTNEVGDAVGAHPQVAEANVYGVLVPHADGRAGCAAVVPAASTATGGPADIDWRSLARHLLDSLPRYAVPVFVRLVRQLDYTGTMKLQKGRLRGEGIDLDAIAAAAAREGAQPDAVYWLPPAADQYVPFRKRDLEELRGGRVRL